MNVCKECGREYSRKDCEFCARVKRWEKSPEETRLKMFPPRIQKELLQLDFTAQEKELTQFHSRFLFGCPGTGKTMLAARIAYELMKKNIAENKLWQNVVFITMPDLLQEIRHTFHRDSAVTEMEVINRYRQADFLILDDFGAEKDTDWAYQIIYTIVNYRYEYLLPTIITSNDTLAKIEHKLNDHRMTSRISEMCEKIHLTRVKRKSL